MAKLTQMQKDFCLHYARSGNATESVIKSGGTKSSKSAAVIGCRNLKMPEVQAEIKRIQEADEMREQGQFTKSLKESPPEENSDLQKEIAECDRALARARRLKAIGAEKGLIQLRAQLKGLLLERNLKNNKSNFRLVIEGNDVGSLRLINEAALKCGIDSPLHFFHQLYAADGADDVGAKMSEKLPGYDDDRYSRFLILLERHELSVDDLEEILDTTVDETLPERDEE